MSKKHHSFPKGYTPWNKGTTMPYPITDEARQNKSNINKGKKVYNNGERNIFLMIGEEIPEGFVEGMYVSDEDRQRRIKQMQELNDKKWHKQ